MKTIRIRRKYQATIPTDIVHTLECRPGDILYIRREKYSFIIDLIFGGVADYKINIRDRYQITLPSQLRKDMAVSCNDIIFYVIENNRIIFHPKTSVVQSPPTHHIDRIERKPEYKKSPEIKFKPDIGNINYTKRRKKN